MNWTDLLITTFMFLNVAFDKADAALSFKDQCVKSHNEYRSRHQVGPLVWSDNLAQGAQSWADYLAENNLFQHAANSPVGENLYLSSRKPMEPCTSATKAFYDEVKYYDYNNPGFSLRTGHFTQVVWKNTKQIGAAYATRKDGRFVLVIRYSPPGNYRFQFSQNVLPIKEETKTTTPTHTEASATSTAPASPGGGVSGRICCSFANKVLLIVPAIIVVKIGF